MLQHHGDEQQSNEEFRHWAKQFALGATGNHPQGKMHHSDQGELRFAIGSDAKTGKVMVNFGKPVAWIGLGKEEAIQLSQLLAEHAKNL